MIDFELTANQPYSLALKEKGIHTFSAACAFVAALPYGRISNRAHFELIIKEGKGTSSSKNGFLAGVAEENHHPAIELMVGIYQMDAHSHPELAAFFEGKPYPHIPETHCYLRYDGERYDFTNQDIAYANQFLYIREQRVDPHQAAEWKQVIHQDYIKRLLARKPEFQLSFEALWTEREKCVELRSFN